MVEVPMPPPPPEFAVGDRVIICRHARGEYAAYGATFEATVRRVGKRGRAYEVETDMKGSDSGRNMAVFWEPATNILDKV